MMIEKYRRHHQESMMFVIAEDDKQYVDLEKKTHTITVNIDHLAQLFI